MDKDLYEKFKEFISTPSAPSGYGLCILITQYNRNRKRQTTTK